MEEDHRSRRPGFAGPPRSCCRRRLPIDSPGSWLLAPACLFGFVLVTAMLLSTRMDPLWQRLRGSVPERMLGFLAKTRKAVYRAAASTRILTRNLPAFAAVLFRRRSHLWAAAMSLGADVGIGYLMATVPLVLVAGMLPISQRPLGITEAGFALFLQLAGVPLVDAVAMGCCLRPPCSSLPCLAGCCS